MAIFCGTGNSLTAQSLPSATELDSPRSTFTLPAGTKAELVLTGPVWARTAKGGDPLYSQVDFPVTAGGRVAIPAGTYVQGRILSAIRPTRRSARAQVQIIFNKIIFANGYVIALPEGALAGPVPGGPDAISTGVPTAATLNIEVGSANDLLLDNGSQIDMTLASSLTLDAGQIAQAAAVSKAPEPGKFKSATLCRPTPGTPGSPGTPDTVIPGSPGTPDVTIPGAPGMPSTTIPGTPATPPTVIPGTPGTTGFPGIVCPPAPIVVSSVPLVLKPIQAQSVAPAVNQ
jgi:hypothetical protein